MLQERIIPQRVRMQASMRTRMLDMASRLDDVITLGRGDPDFHAPAHVAEAAKAALDRGETHYTPPAGLPQLREAIALKLQRENGLDYAADEIVVTNGCQEALFLLLQVLIGPGDELLLQEPRYNAYDHMTELAGGAVISAPTRQEDDFALTAAQVQARLTPRTKAIAVVTPNNPTGGVIPPRRLAELAALCVERDLVVISDEIYEKLMYDGLEHASLGAFPGMRERTVTVNGFAKAYAMTGLRVGYFAAPRAFVQAVIEIKHTMSICTATPMQWAALAALTGPQEVVEEMRQEYDRRRRALMEALDDMDLTYGHPGGGMYIYVNVAATGLDSETFCLRLLQEEGVMIFPGTLFGDSRRDHVRITLLQPLDDIRRATERMKRFLARI